MPRTARVPDLAEGEVHAWRFDLGAHVPGGGEVHAEDLQRAERFAFARDRARFLRARQVMRGLVAAYLGTDAASTEIAYGMQGKPHVDARFGLSFNLSHSGDHGLIAFARGVEVGVDIEEIQPLPGLRTLAATVMSPKELEALRVLPDAAITVPFLTCWTRKEACLKAIGVGLAVEPRTFTVGIHALRTRVRLPEAGVDAVEIASLFDDGRCVGALAVAGRYSRARLMEWRA